MASPFASDSDIVILGAPTLTDRGEPDIFFAKRGGVTPTGKARKPRYTIEIRSEPVLLDLNDEMLGQETAVAIRDLISEQIRHITEPVKAATVRFRAKAKRSYDAGASWAQKRYSGGRIGPKPPDPNSRRKFNDSGRLAEGVFVRPNPKDKVFTVNLPTNRFNPEVSGVGVVLEWFSDLRRLVPALDPRKAVTYQPVQAAVKRDLDDMVVKAESAHAAKLKRLAMLRKQTLKRAAMALLQALV